MKKLMIVVISCLLLTSCSVIPDNKKHDLLIDGVERIEHKVPEELTMACLPDKVIDIDSYLQMKFYERENHLTDYINHLIYTISICNTRLRAIRINQGYEDDSQ